ncbi:MAG TPA: hypothetical protein VMW73_01875 [Spirochaetia bacterium]|nr:hypothetical protein [Spirochaetia bacterium]
MTEVITTNLGIIPDIFRRQLTIDEIVVIGSGGKGTVWRLIMADVYGADVAKEVFERCYQALEPVLPAAGNTGY